jgi:hypothetical protein
MSKAYDRVEWNFLEQMLLKIGFAQEWVQLIMRCISSQTYRIKVNGALTECITPMRGLRQGYPISSYLFLVCAEGFSSLLNVVEARGELTGIKVCSTAPSINHLLFADDSLLLLKINDGSAQCLQNILSLYEDGSGQIINKEKLSIMFSRITNDAEKQELMASLDIGSEARNEKYLGLPVYMGRSK